MCWGVLTSRFSLRMTFVTVPSYLKTIWSAEARTGDSAIRELLLDLLGKMMR